MLLYCQACGAAQMVPRLTIPPTDDLDPCWRCDGLTFATLHPVDRWPQWRPTSPLELAPPLRYVSTDVSPDVPTGMRRRPRHDDV